MIKIGFKKRKKGKKEEKKEKKEEGKEKEKPVKKEKKKEVKLAPLVLLRPIVTEKAVRLAEQGKYVFEVAKDAPKPEIKKAIEEIYNVKVKKVNIIKVKPKTKRLGRIVGRKSGFKKAIVTLKEGKIEIFPK